MSNKNINGNFTYLVTSINIIGQANINSRPVVFQSELSGETECSINCQFQGTLQ